MMGALTPFAASASINLIQDGDFATPVLNPGGYEYGATGTPWNFASLAFNGPAPSGSGVTYLPSAWDGGRSAPPPGTQVAFLQGAGGVLSQTMTGVSAGAYDLTFIDAGRPAVGSSYGGDLTFQVLINGNVVDTLTTVDGQAFAPVTLDVSLINGDNTLEFAGFSANNYNGDDSAFIANVSLTAVPEPATILSGVLMLLPFGASTLRILRRNRAA